jgi:DNA-binding transcriptional regulator GbsR (MarR family)
MELTAAREKFLDTWGQMGSNWGICKTMAQIHGLLLISTEPLNTDQIMANLNISRGNVHCNVAELQEWELIRKTKIDGCRKDYYEAEKDIWTVFVKIIKQRKKKELEPIIGILGELRTLECNCDGSSEFCKVIEDIHLFSTKTDKALENIVSSKSSWLINNYLKMVR